MEGILTEPDGGRFKVRYGRDRPGAHIPHAALSLGQGATNLIAFGTLPPPTFKVNKAAVCLFKVLSYAHLDGTRAEAYRRVRAKC